MRFVTCLALLGLVVASMACAPLQPPEPEGFGPQLHTNNPASIGGHTRAQLAGAMTSGPMSLESAVQVALLNNPGLQADFAAFEAAAQVVPQASSLLDPRVSYAQFVEGVQTRTGEQQYAASISQMLPWFGKLRLRGEVANSMAMQSLQSYRANMLVVRERVQKAWYRLAYEQAALLLAEEDKRTIVQTLDAASALYGSGERGRGALLKAQAELARIESELLGYPARIAVLREELGRLLFVDRVPDVPVLEATVGDDFVLANAGALIAAALVQRPEIKRLRLQAKEAQLNHELALRDYYPDLTLGLNYVGIGDRPDNPMGEMAPSDEGDDSWGISLGFSIPIPNARRRAAELQALRSWEESEWRRIASESEIGEQVRGLLQRLAAIDHQLHIIKANLLPLAKEAYSTNKSDYSSGNATFLDFLDSQRTLIAVRRELLRARRDYLLAIAELERVVGGSLVAEELP